MLVAIVSCNKYFKKPLLMWSTCSDIINVLIVIYYVDIIPGGLRWL